MLINICQLLNQKISKRLKVQCLRNDQVVVLNYILIRIFNIILIFEESHQASKQKTSLIFSKVGSKQKNSKFQDTL